MTKQEYNGWTNYETWVVKLWIDNDEGSYNYWQEQTESAIECAVRHGADSGDVVNDAANQIAEQLKSEHEESLPEVQGFASDLLNAAMSEVDWYEIAESMVNDMIADHPELIEQDDDSGMPTCADCGEVWLPDHKCEVL